MGFQLRRICCQRLPAQAKDEFHIGFGKIQPLPLQGLTFLPHSIGVEVGSCMVYLIQNRWITVLQCIMNGRKHPFVI